VGKHRKSTAEEKSRAEDGGKCESDDYLSYNCRTMTKELRSEKNIRGLPDLRKLKRTAYNKSCLALTGKPKKPKKTQT